MLSTVPGSPAERAGIGKGSVIEAVGGKPVAGSADDAASLLRGEDGSQLELSLKGVEKAVVLSREKIKPRPVTWALKSVAGKKVCCSSISWCWPSARFSNRINAALFLAIEWDVAKLSVPFPWQ